MKPWEQQPGESSQAFRAARVYFELGSKRSLAEVAACLSTGPDETSGAPREDQRGPRKASSTLKRWSKRWRWVERAEAFDRNLTTIGDQAREAEVASHAVIQEQRRAKVAETAWILSQAGLDKVAEMLRFGLTETSTESTTSQDGKTTIVRTTVQPAKWRLRDIATLLRTFDDLQRIAVGMPNRVPVPGIRPSESLPADLAQADADNARCPEWAAEAWLDLVAQNALRREGREDAQPPE